MPDSIDRMPRVVYNVALGDQVRIRNVGPTPIKWTWDSRPYIIAVGADGHVPFDLMKMQCGDPRSSDIIQSCKDQYNNPQFIPDRLSEVRRLQQFHTNSTPQFREYIPGDDSYLADGISDRCPQVEVYTLAGDRIYTVIDDPLGDRVIAATATRSDAIFAAETMQAQSKEIVELRKLVDLMAKKLNVDPQDLGPDLPLPRADPLPEPPQSIVKPNPGIVFNPRTGKVAARTVPGADPTTLDALPEDD